jgi:hypothetical protein
MGEHVHVSESHGAAGSGSPGVHPLGAGSIFGLNASNWIKHSFGAVLAGIYIDKTGETLYLICKESISSYASLGSIYRGLMTIGWFRIFILAYLLMNTLRYVLASFATDDISLDKLLAKDQGKRSKRLEIPDIVEIVFSLAPLVALGFAATAASSVPVFLIASLFVVVVDLGSVLSLLFVPALFSHWQVNGLPQGSLKKYNRRLINWILIDLFEAAVWLVLIFEMTANQGQPLKIVCALSLLFALGLDYRANREFWDSLAAPTGP